MYVEVTPLVVAAGVEEQEIGDPLDTPGVVKVHDNASPGGTDPFTPTTVAVNVIVEPVALHCVTPATLIEIGSALAIAKVIGAELAKLYVVSPWNSAVTEYVPAVIVGNEHERAVVGTEEPEVSTVGATEEQVSEAPSESKTIQVIDPKGAGNPVFPATKAVTVVTPPIVGEAGWFNVTVGIKLEIPRVTVLETPAK